MTREVTKGIFYDNKKYLNSRTYKNARRHTHIMYRYHLFRTVGG